MNVIELLTKYDQKQLLAFEKDLTNDQIKALYKDIESIDFELLKQLYENAGKPVTLSEGDTYAPIQVEIAPKVGEKNYDKYYNAGIASIKRDEVIAITMAGGQGSRLGHDGPKGTYDIGLPNHKSLFELLCDSLKDVHEKSGVYPMWYIMTSETNNDDSIKFFKENNYFGYPKERIVFFQQEMFPVLTLDGKVLLANKGKILRSPNGNGGIFHGLKENKILENSINRGVKYAFVCAVDNPLVKMCDPLQIGYMEITGKEASAKTFMKRSFDEKAGVYCLKNGKPTVIEYTEVSDEMAKAVDDNGDFLYGDANVNNIVFRIDVLDKAMEKGLPYHTYIKKVTKLSDNGEIVTSSEPDSYKFEMFMFDIFNNLNDISVYRIIREEEFAPVKNKEGIDGPQIAREYYMKQHNM